MTEKINVVRNHQVALEFGGLRLEVYYTSNFGDSTRVFAVSDPAREMLRFDDFVDTPHYHAPADDPNQIDLDPALDGEPREFFLRFLAERLSEVLPSIGFGHVLETLDLDEIRRNTDVVRAAMDAVLVEGFHRAPGRCLQDADPERPHLRDEANARFAARLQAVRDEQALRT